MNEKSRYYDEPEAEAAPEEVDPRVIAMQQVVEAEKRAQWAQREAERAQKQAAGAAEELSEARDHLNGLLGLPSNAAINKPARSADWGMTR